MIDQTLTKHLSPRVVVWRSTWLAGSETFVRRHTERLRRWNAVPSGIWRADSPLASAADVIYTERPAPRSSRMQVGLASLVTRRHLRTVIEDSGAKLVHVHFLNDAVPVVRAARNLDVPVIVTVHGHDVTRWPTFGGRRTPIGTGVRLYRRWIAARTLRRATIVIAVSEAIRERALELGAPEDRTIVRYLGIPIPPKPPPRPENPELVKVLFVGRLVQKKGVDHLLRAWSSLPSSITRSSELRIIGDGPLLPELRALANKLEVGVEFSGALASDEVLKHMQGSHILCVPSRTASNGDTEGLPIALLEACAQELAVVAYRHSGIPEALTHSVDGLLADEGDLNSFTTLLAQAIRDAQLRKRLGRAARQRVEQEFDIDTQTRLLEALYDQVIAAGPQINKDLTIGSDVARKKRFLR